MKSRLILLVLMFFISMSTSYSQLKFKHGVEISTGLFNYHFDDTPVLNLNYRGEYYSKNNKGKRNIGDVFNGLLYNSFGLRYVNRKKEGFEWTIGFNSMFENYRGAFIEFHDTKGGLTHFSRERYLFEYTFLKVKNLSKKLNWKYGIGTSIRLGRNSIIMYYNVWGYTEEGIPYGDGIIGGARYRDFGILLHTELSYQIIPRLNFNVYLQSRFFPLRTDFENIKKLKETYEIKNVPEFLDLSFNLGLSYNFGKK